MFWALLMVLVFISYSTLYQILFAVNTGVITRYTIFTFLQQWKLWYSLSSPLSQSLCGRFFDSCELSFRVPFFKWLAGALFLIVFLHLRSSSRVKPSYILHFSFALAAVSSTIRLRDTSPIFYDSFVQQSSVYELSFGNPQCAQKN